MPKQVLTGTLDEQCAFLYTLAQEKMTQGNFTGAVHALQEIAKHAPHFRDVQTLLAEAQWRKAQQRRLLIAGLLGAIVFVGIGSTLRLSNDLLLILLAVVGAVVGYGVGNYLESFRQPTLRLPNRTKRAKL
jgi:hypothetical protein